MHLVDDVHALCERVVGEKIASSRSMRTSSTPLLDAASSSDHVENGAVRNAAAGVALVAGVSVHRVLAVDRLGENVARRSSCPCRGCR